MDQQTMDELLMRVIATSSTWDECKERIKKAYGPEWLTAAEVTARRERYRDWFASIDAERPLVVVPEPMPDEEDESDVTTAMHVKVSKIQLLVPKIEIELKKPAVLKMPGRWKVDNVLLAVAAVMLVAVLFPPFHAPLSGGLATNLGFHFLLSPPRVGNLTGLVNVPLLVLELVVTFVIGALVALVGRLADGRG